MPSADRGWTALSLIGIALWIGVTVLVAVLNDEPSEPGPVLLAFAGGGAAFFAAVFGLAWWRTRPRADPELDALVAELALDPSATPQGARAIGGMRRTARAYIALGALVTALGLAAIVEEGLGFGSATATVVAIVIIVVVWAAAVPLVMRRAEAASEAVLGPLGLAQSGTCVAGKRHGRRVTISFTRGGSSTRVESEAQPPALAGEAIAAHAGRDDGRLWSGVEVSAGGGAITVRRRGHDGAAWLWDLWLAERLAGAA